MTHVQDPVGSLSRQIKCVIWDLDNTLWQGILLEGDDVRPFPHIPKLLRELDERGILHSIASKNEREPALERLRSLGLEEYFLVPQIGWQPKSQSISRIAEALNLGVESLAFVDDQAFERDEVTFSVPQVACYAAEDSAALAELPEFMPRFVTDDSARRRSMYQADLARQAVEADFEGPKDAFLASLGMRMTISPATEDDLQRVEELTVRTNQLNATGYTYSYETLRGFIRGGDHQLLVVELEDRYGSYGKVGIALIDVRDGRRWLLKLLLMSCRVASRGVGNVLLGHIANQARDRGVARLCAEFIKTDRNHLMYVTYRLAGFREAGQAGEAQLLEMPLDRRLDMPGYVEVVASGLSSSAGSQEVCHG
ncbi:MAG: HAD-IIIC family phosphatase [Myxococcales bacterium]|nr:HAD-IIIC family phosphatase [Myxococcales bacterium]MDD9972050.1 HAD-IIIC family phosphatase [Myxococcales bacterium]